MKNATFLTLARLVRLLETDRSLPDFPVACLRLHVCPGPLNETLLRELGESGEEILMHWRCQICESP